MIHKHCDLQLKESMNLYYDHHFMGDAARQANQQSNNDSINSTEWFNIRDPRGGRNRHRLNSRGSRNQNINNNAKQNTNTNTSNNINNTNSQSAFNTIDNSTVLTNNENNIDDLYDDDESGNRHKNNGKSEIGHEQSDYDENGNHLFGHNNNNRNRNSNLNSNKTNQNNPNKDAFNPANYFNGPSDRDKPTIHSFVDTYADSVPGDGNFEIENETLRNLLKTRDKNVVEDADGTISLNLTQINRQKRKQRRSQAFRFNNELPSNVDSRDLTDEKDTVLTQTAGNSKTSTNTKKPVLSSNDLLQLDYVKMKEKYQPLLGRFLFHCKDESNELGTQLVNVLNEYSNADSLARINLRNEIASIAAQIEVKLGQLQQSKQSNQSGNENKNDENDNTNVSTGPNFQSNIDPSQQQIHSATSMINYPVCLNNLHLIISKKQMRMTIHQWKIWNN